MYINLLPTATEAYLDSSYADFVYLADVNSFPVCYKTAIMQLSLRHFGKKKKYYDTSSVSEIGEDRCIHVHLGLRFYSKKMEVVWTY